MNTGISFAAVTIILVILVLTTAIQTAYAWSLYVDLSKSAFGMKRANVELTGPIGYKDRKSVETGPNAAVTFNVPTNAVPVGYQFKVCTHSEGLIGTILPNCMFFTYNGGNPRIWMNVPG